MDRRLKAAAVPVWERPVWRKWMRYYLDFCGKYRHPPRSGAGLGPFLEKLASKNQSTEQQEQARLAVGWLLAPCREAAAAPESAPARRIGSPRPARFRGLDRKNKSIH